VQDDKSLHAGCPVIKGHKWSATKWIRAEHFYMHGEKMDEEQADPKKRAVQLLMRQHLLLQQLSQAQAQQMELLRYTEEEHKLQEKKAGTGTSTAR